MNTAMENYKNEFIYNEEYYKFIFKGEENNNYSKKDILITNKRELEILLLCLDNNFIVANENYNNELYNYLNNELANKTLKWDYKNPKEVYNIISKISMPDSIKDKLLKSTSLISKEFVHKLNQKNVLISYPERLGNILYFRGFTKSDEFQSDHTSDHFDGIKLFEAVRQTTLASFHIMGVPLGKIMALTTVSFNFNKFIELNAPYFIQVIPVCKSDGGSMFCIFKIIQNNESHDIGYIHVYTFRTKEDYKNKRFNIL